VHDNETFGTGVDENLTFCDVEALVRPDPETVKVTVNSETVELMA